MFLLYVVKDFRNTVKRSQGFLYSCVFLLLPLGEDGCILFKICLGNPE